jgi:rhamnulokinase
LWVLQECLRTWRGRDDTVTLDGLLAAAADEPAARSPFDIGDRRLLPPGDMPARVATLCAEAGVPVPGTPPQVARAVVDALAAAHADAVRDLERLTGTEVDVVHVVGGGSLNRLLCQSTADACGRLVLAGPVESTAMGNVLVQARALGVDLPDLEAMRELVRSRTALGPFVPRRRLAPQPDA